MYACPESSFDPSFRSTGLRSSNTDDIKQANLPVGIYARRTHQVGEGGAAALIACSALLHGLYICSSTCITQKKAYMSSTRPSEKNEHKKNNSSTRLWALRSAVLCMQHVLEKK